MPFLSRCVHSPVGDAPARSSWASGEVSLCSTLGPVLQVPARRGSPQPAAPWSLRCRVGLCVPGRPAVGFGANPCTHPSSISHAERGAGLITQRRAGSRPPADVAASSEGLSC